MPHNSAGLSRADLASRGWTKALIKKYLGDHHHREAVHHWPDFTGRDMFWVARVKMAEEMRMFRADLPASNQRRRQVEGAKETRTR